MNFQINDRVIHLQSGLKGRVVSTSDKNPEGRIVVECTIENNGQVGYKILTELPTHFKLLDSEVVFSLRLPLDEHILEKGMEMLLEVKVKHQGVWVIHKYDADDNFPSDLHAHNKDAAEVLDLYTGDIYDTKTKLNSLSKKAMNHIYSKIMSCKENEIKQKFINNKNNITYIK